MEKADSETPPIQTPPINPMYSLQSPSTALAPPNPVVAPHYYPAPAHHNVIYPHHIPPVPSNGLYPIPQSVEQI